MRPPLRDLPDKLRVMLVDDDADERRLLARFLRGCGCVVFAQADGAAAALRLLREAPTPADLIVTDCHMSDGDGLSLTRALRRAGDPTPVIMFSGHTGPEARAAAREAGVTRFVAKPFEAERFLDAIYHVLGRRVARVA